MNKYDYTSYIEILSKILDLKSNIIKSISKTDLINYNPLLINNIFNDLINYQYATWDIGNSSINNFQFSDIENYAKSVVLEYIDAFEPGVTYYFLTTLKNMPVDSIDWTNPDLQNSIQCLDSFKLIDVSAEARYKITEFGKLILSKL